MRTSPWTAALLLGAAATLAATARGQDGEPAPQPAPQEPEPAANPQEEPAKEPRALFAGTAAELAAAHPHVELRSIGTSAGGRPLEVLEVRGEGEITWVALVVAGLSGDRDGDERRLALDLAAELAGQAGSIPDGVAVQVLADANPDATAFAAGAHPRAGNDTPVDDDRDGETDEDRADDLDGDGVLSWMRFPDATGELHVALTTSTEPTPTAPEKADARRDKPPTHRLVREGRDDDGDGLWNEDGPGGVDLSRNFPYRFEEHTRVAGRWAASEPETRAIMDHLLADERIAVVYELGAAELTGDKMPPWNGAWSQLPGDDLKLYDVLREMHPKGVETKRAPQAPGAGGLATTAVHQLGRIWFGRAPLGRSGPTWPGGDTPWPEHLAVVWTPVGGAGVPKGAEIGKIVPVEGRSPPGPMSGESDAAREFLLAAARGRARLTFENTRQSGEPGVLKVRTRLVNHGRLPTHLARAAEVRGRRPVNVRIALPEGATLRAGDPSRQIERIDAGGESDELAWVIVGPSRSKATVTATSPDAGTVTLEVEIP